jgi:hypothetical protein
MASGTTLELSLLTHALCGKKHFISITYYIFVLLKFIAICDPIGDRICKFVYFLSH